MSDITRNLSYNDINLLKTQAGAKEIKNEEQEVEQQKEIQE